MKSQQATPAPDFSSPKDAPGRASAEKAQRGTTTAWFRKRRFVLPAALTVSLVIIVAASGWLGSDTLSTTTSNPQPTATKAPKAVTPGIGSAAVDGKFTFVVTGVERPGRTMPGKLNTTLTAKGEFVIVRVDVTNIATVPKALDCQCQVLLNEAGRRYMTSPAILSTKEALKFVQLISPGDTVKGTLLLFDVAPGTKVTKVELHDTPLTQGAQVTLS